MVSRRLVIFGGAAAAGGLAVGYALMPFSTVELADLTNSPISLNFSRTNLLSTPNSLASSWTRVFATVGYYSFWSVTPRRRGRRTS